MKEYEEEKLKIDLAPLDKNMAYALVEVMVIVECTVNKFACALFFVDVRYCEKILLVSKQHTLCQCVAQVGTSALQCHLSSEGLKAKHNVLALYNFGEVNHMGWLITLVLHLLEQGSVGLCKLTERLQCELVDLKRHNEEDADHKRNKTITFRPPNGSLVHTGSSCFHFFLRFFLRTCRGQ